MANYNYRTGAFACGGLFAIFILVLIGAGIAFRNTLSSIAARVTLSTAGGSAFICWVLLIVFLILHHRSAVNVLPADLPIEQVIGGRDIHGCVLPYTFNDVAGKCVRFDKVPSNPETPTPTPQAPDTPDGCGAGQVRNTAGECETVSSPTPVPQIIGGRDEHGCTPGAGQRWNEAAKKCQALDGSLIEPKQPPIRKLVKNRFFCEHPWDALTDQRPFRDKAGSCPYITTDTMPRADFPETYSFLADCVKACKK